MQLITPDLVKLVTDGKLGGTLLDDGALRYVVFLGPVRMEPIIRNARESITTTVAGRAGSFDVVVNGNYYDVSMWGAVLGSAGFAASASSTTIQGRIVANGKVVAGDSRPQRFYLAEVINTARREPKDDKRSSRNYGGKRPAPPPPYRFEVGRGDPLTGPGTMAALGNLGPLIAHGLPYGVGNQYRPPATGPATGDPGPKLGPALTQRNDNTFASVERRDDRTGKTIVAWHQKAGALLVGVEKDHEQGRPGETYTRLTHLLAAAGFTDGVFLDGSDSAMLWYKGRMIVAPGERKADTMTVALGFRAEPAPAPEPEPSQRAHR